MLADPAEEEFLAALPPEQYEQEIAAGQIVVDRHADGTLPGLVRDMFGSFAPRLTADEQLRALMLDAYVSCYATRTQARMVADEKRLVLDCLPGVRQSRAGRVLPDVPVVVFSATTVRSPEQREMCTGLHAELAAAVPQGTHIVLADTSHATNQERLAEIAGAVNRIIAAIRERG